MVYSTRFDGGVEGPEELVEVFVNDADDGKTYGQYGNDLTDWISEFFGGDTASWYDWKKDMVSLSKEYPNLLFWLEGEGEESGDIWKAWARNGKVVTSQARIVFDEPDLDKELPTPDAAKAIAKVKADKAAKIDAEIARLEALKESL